MSLVRQCRHIPQSGIQKSLSEMGKPHEGMEAHQKLTRINSSHVPLLQKAGLESTCDEGMQRRCFFKAETFPVERCEIYIRPASGHFCDHLHRSRTLILPDIQSRIVGTHLRPQAAAPSEGSAASILVVWQMPPRSVLRVQEVSRPFS